MEPRTKKKIAKAASVTTDAAALTVGAVLRTGIKAILTLLLVFLCTGMVFACIFAVYVQTSLTTDLDISLSDFTLALSSTIYYTDSEGRYQEMTTIKSTEERFWVDLENMPGVQLGEKKGYLELAAVAIEDKRFYEHRGVDWYRTVGAFANMFLSMKNDFGGSTLTQQLIKNITGDDDITVQRKLAEIFRALEFEKTYEKDEIIEWYLNAVYFGSGAYGVGAAAHKYFDKEVWDLSLSECASIIAITNNPSIYSPFVSREKNTERRNIILFEMYDQGYISFSEYTAAVNEEVLFTRGVNESAEIEIYSYYEEVVIQDVIRDIMEQKDVNRNVASTLLENGGLSIYACIDMDIQKIVDNFYENPENMPKSWSPSQQPFQSAMVIMNPYDGKIVALTGGVGEKTINYGWNRATDAKRPPGSSMKPIATYGQAMEMNLISQYTLVNDAPNIVLSGHPTWYPSNAGGGNSGIVTIREALRASLNTVSAQILDKIGAQNSYNFLRDKLGFEGDALDPADADYAPLALGQLTNGTTVRNMAQAFAAFPNDGVFTYSRTYTHVNDSSGKLYLDNQPNTKVAFKVNTARNMVNMLQNACEHGTGTSAAIYGMPTAGKTGTTSFDYDRYFVGFTSYYLAAVWTGYDQPEKMYFSDNPACQIFRSVMTPIHEGLPRVEFSTEFSYGTATGVFGDLEVTPEPTETPEPTKTPKPTEEPDEETTPSPTQTYVMYTPDSDDDTRPTQTAPPPTQTVEPTRPVEPSDPVDTAPLPDPDDE